MYACHDAYAWDATMISDSLIGEWEWVSMVCPLLPVELYCDSLPNFTVEFISDSTLIVLQNDSLYQTASWELSETQGNYQMITNPPIYTLQGNILFCGEIVMFSLSFIDGCDDSFKRIK